MQARHADGRRLARLCPVLGIAPGHDGLLPVTRSGGWTMGVAQAGYQPGKAFFARRHLFLALPGRHEKQRPTPAGSGRAPTSTASVTGACRANSAGAPCRIRRSCNVVPLRTPGSNESRAAGMPAHPSALDPSSQRPMVAAIIPRPGVPAPEKPAGSEKLGHARKPCAARPGPQPLNPAVRRVRENMLFLLDRLS